jgi:hypothetical protein
VEKSHPMKLSVGLPPIARRQMMQLPLQITLRHMDPSPAIEARIQQRAEELAQFFDRITSCRVVVGCSQRGGALRRTHLQSAEGPQASTVVPLGKHHPVPTEAD